MVEHAVTQSLELLRRAQIGDRDALNRLFERYYERVRPIVRARISSRLRRRVDSGDILQQVFKKAAEIYDRFDVESEANIIGWLARIAERQIRDEVDKGRAEKRRHEQAPTGSDSAPTLEVPGPDPGPSSAAFWNEEQRRLEDALAQLPELYREVILLRDYQGMTWQQVADELGRPSADAARMTYNTATVKLGELLRRDGLGASE